MSRSKTGLNEPFYQWLDEVRRAIRKEKELKEKLRYYEMKLTSCRGITYDRIGSASTSGNERDLYYWMDKVNETKNQIDKFKVILQEYRLFIENLDPQQQMLLQARLNAKAFTKSSSKVDRNGRSMSQNLMNSIVRQYESVLKKT
jgi:hypothetical protein